MQPTYRRIERSERPVAPGAKRVASLDPNEKVAFTIRVRRRPSAPPMPELPARNAVWGGPRMFLSREGLIARAGADQADIDRVTDFVLRQGLEVLETSVPRRSIRARGTAAQIKSNFNVDLGLYESPTQQYRGREGYIYVPNEVADVVTGVFGLDNRKVFRHNMGTTPPGAEPLTPTEVARLYNFPKLHPTVAQGRSIAILELGDGGFSQTDLGQFCTSQGIPTPTPTLISVDGQSTSQNGNAGSPDPADIETCVDTQIVAAIAQGADIFVFFAGDGNEVDLLTTAAFFDYPTPLSAISICWGANEENVWGDWQDLDDAFNDISWLGVPILAASGDYGSNCYGNGQSIQNDGAAHVQYPSSSAWVTACGGTIITNVKGTKFDEDVWNDSTGATGGGLSTLNGVPGWQQGLTFTQVDPSQAATPLTGRGVPDVAGNASPNSGYPIVAYGTAQLIGGTSTVAPLYAGLMTIFAAKVGWSMGLLNLLLYQIAGSTPSAFVDIKDGVSNELSAAAGGTTPCPAYVSTKGWDACTGLGRINGVALLDAIILAEETRPIAPNIPFSFGGGGEWLYQNDGGGADDTGDDIDAGQDNYADPDDCTTVTTPCTDNATFACINTASGNGAVGLFGRSQGSSWSIGVAGESQTGVAVYGIATGEQPTSPNVVGVVGRSMGGIATEILPIEQVVDTPIGVLGHSNTGLGVRGHGGPLLKQPQGKETLPAAQAAPGGAFSSGRLHDIKIAEVGVQQTTSLDALQQLRLVPSTTASLPAAGLMGDLYVNATGNLGDPGGTITVTMYLCVQPGDGVTAKALWAPFTLGTPVTGG